MDHSPEAKLQALQDQVQRGEYEIDPRKVADAIIARLMLEAAPPRG